MRREDGASGLEYVALLLLVGLVIVALALSGVSPRTGDAVELALCRIFSIFEDEECIPVADGPGEPGAPVPEEELNRLGVPCLVDRDVAGLEVLGIFRFAAGDVRIGYVIDQVGTDTFRVTFYGDIGGGLGAMGGAAPGFFPPLRGPFGFIVSTIGAGGAASFDFDSRAEAEAFVGSLVPGSGPQPPGMFGGPGQLIGGLFQNVVGGGVGDPEHSFTHIVVGGRGSGNGGYNVGANAGVDGAGAMEGVLSEIHRDGDFNGWTIFTGQLEGVGSLRIGAGGLRWAGGTGGALRYRVMWDEQRRPIRLTLIQETQGVEGGGFTGGGQGNRWGSGGLSEMEHGITISEMHLDLTDPTNLDLFNRTFYSSPGMYAAPRNLVPTTVAEPGGDHFWWQRLLGRMDEEGVFIDYEYAETVTTGEGAGGRGRNGVMVDGTLVDRRLLSATIVDQQWENPVPQDFGACFSDDPAWGVPGGAGDPIGSPP